MKNKNYFPLLTIAEAAELMGSVSPKTIRREILAGRIMAVRARPARNAKLLIPYGELIRWVEEEASKRVFIPRDAGQPKQPLKLVRSERIRKAE